MRSPPQPDYMNTTRIASRGPCVEGQAVWRVGNRYYLWGSHLTGWAPNPALLSYADDAIAGATWTPLGNPSVRSALSAIARHPRQNDATTFDSQSAFVLPYVHPNGTMLPIYMGVCGWVTRHWR